MQALDDGLTNYCGKKLALKGLRSSIVVAIWRFFGVFDIEGS